MQLEEMKQLIPSFLYAPVVLAVWILCTWLLKKVVFRRLRFWAEKSGARWNDRLIHAISFPVNALLWLAGLGILENLLPLPAKAERFVMLALQGGVIFTIALLLERLIKVLVEKNISGKFFSQVSPNLVKGLARGFILGLAILIFLDMIGISITPILASLGIGSVAVALALQDTLSNFFAGIYVAVDKPVQEGDFVKLETGHEGYVTNVGWRSTRIRTGVDNVVIIPNSKLIGSVITNYNLPTRELTVIVKFYVGYVSDLERVEKISLEVARDVIKGVRGAVARFEPSIRFMEFDECGIQTMVVLRAAEAADGALLQHEFLKRIHPIFQKEGIVLSSPQRTLDLSKQMASELRDLFKR